MVNLVFKIISPDEVRKCHFISLRYKLQGETETSVSQLAYEIEDGWWTCELYQITSGHRIVDLEILFDGYDDSYTYLAAEGIMFLPLEKVEYKDEKQPISDRDENLPTDYEDIMKWSKVSAQWTTKKEAYSIIRKGFLIDDGEKWFFLDKNGKKCHMTSVRSPSIMGQEVRLLSLPESRFGEAVWCDFRYLTISTESQSQLLSPLTTYATYLVHTLPEDQFGFKVPMKVKVELKGGDLSSDNCQYIHLLSPQPLVIRPKADQNTHKLVNRPNIKGLPQQRNDGWMEVQISEFQTATTTEMICFNVYMSSCEYLMLNRGLIIEGVEFRPI